MLSFMLHGMQPQQTTLMVTVFHDRCGPIHALDTATIGVVTFSANDWLKMA